MACFYDEKTNAHIVMLQCSAVLTLIYYHIILIAYF